jgi:hypothetical protein
MSCGRCASTFQPIPLSPHECRAAAELPSGAVCRAGLELARARGSYSRRLVLKITICDLKPFSLWKDVRTYPAGIR